MTDPLGAAAFDALLGRTGGAVLLLVDSRLRILRAGVEAALLAERTPAQLVGMSLIAAFGSAALDGICRTAAASGEAAIGEAELGRGGERSFAVEAVPIPDSASLVETAPRLPADLRDPATGEEVAFTAAGHEAAALVVALHDVSTLRRVERVRRDFVANISHELRTPLASIKLLAETLGAGAVEDPATARDFVTQIEREADHLAQLVDELLDLSMIESGETTLAIEALDPDVVLDAVAGRIGPVAKRRGIRITRPPTDDGSRGARAAADAARIGQAILNLAHNAVKYSHPGGEVRLGWELHGDRVRFTVSDDGIGVPASHQPRIFERFYKVDRARARERTDESPATVGGSAGLGLAIVRHIAEAHRGAVGLTSVEGSGSTFWIEVPVAT
jgi:signal transduction histidine kinase